MSCLSHRSVKSFLNINILLQLSSGARGIYFGLSFHLCLSFMCVSEKRLEEFCVISQTVEPSLLVYEISTTIL